MKTFDWHEQLVVGDEGEQRFIAALSRNGRTVVDLRSDPVYRKRDIDFEVGGKTFEVKTDTHDTGNIFFELVDGNGKPGCVFKSRADLWAYIFPRQDVAYVMPMPDLLLWLVDRSHDYEMKTITSQRGKQRWTVLGIAVPIVALTEDGIAKRVRLPNVSGEERSTVA